MFMKADADAGPNAPIRTMDRSKCLTANRIAEAKHRDPRNMAEVKAAAMPTPLLAVEAYHAKNAPAARTVRRKKSNPNQLEFAL
jgi:hypothetical protein